MRGQEVADRVVCNAVAAGKNPMKRADTVNSVIEELEQEEEGGCFDNIYLQGDQGQGCEERGKEESDL